MAKSIKNLIEMASRLNAEVSCLFQCQGKEGVVAEMLVRFTKTMYFQNLSEIENCVRISTLMSASLSVVPWVVEKVRKGQIPSEIHSFRYSYWSPVLR